MAPAGRVASSGSRVSHTPHRECAATRATGRPVAFPGSAAPATRRPRVSRDPSTAPSSAATLPSIDGTSAVRGAGSSRSCMGLEVVQVHRREPSIRRTTATARLLVGSRIIRRGLLPPARYWTSVRAVELRCESTWRLLSGRSLSGRLSLHHLACDRLPEKCVRSRVAPRGDTRGAEFSAAARAYSSIGQSPRLITGLFLVRTQVGPLVARRRFDYIANQGAELK